MDGIIFSILKAYDLLQVHLSFGSFDFKVIDIWISFFGISLAGIFFGKLLSR